MVRTALDRRHALAGVEASAGRSSLWPWTRHGGGGRAEGIGREKNSGTSWDDAGCRIQVPRRGTGSGGAKGPFCFWQEQKS